MRLSAIVTLSLLSSTLMFANTALMEKAQQNGLLPIPSDTKQLFKIIDPKQEMTTKRIDLGRTLYFDPRLSKSGLISCHTCHNLGLGGVDGISTAIGHQWHKNPRALNSPTVYNAVFFKSQFWDGRSPNLEEQAKGPMVSGVEMAAPVDMIEKRVNSMPGYVEAFQKAYGNDVKIDFDTITATIALFERTLVTPSRYDRFLEGDHDALNDAEKKGLEIFIDKGCVTCHNGIALGGEKKPFELASKYKHRDIGGFVGDGQGLVKVPTLRNITETAPYFHNGAIWDLKEAIKMMSQIQVGYKVNKTEKQGFNLQIMPIELSDEEIDKIRLFFNALEGKKPTIKYPQLPKSTLETPKPDAQ